MNEFENIPYMRVDGIRTFINTVMYRMPHFHKCLEIILVLSGSMIVNTEHRTFPLASHDIIVINSGSPHELAAQSTGCTFLCLQFLPDSYVSNMPLLLFEQSLPREVLSGVQYQQLEYSLLDLARKYFYRAPFYEVYCVSTALRIFYDLLENVPYHTLSDSYPNSQELMSARLMRLVNYVDQNYPKKLSLSDFAESEGKSLSYISRFAKNALNQSFQSYVNTVRYYAACRLIADGKMSMLDICYEVGFSDYRYFSNIFKERTGLTPAEYQKKSSETQHKIIPNSDIEHIYSDKESAAFLEELVGKGRFPGKVSQ